ncbi:MAG: hypothetical protein QOG43_2693 [Actinomycetota bacterium]|jgi:hypothetical protein|nr:hypothetical protein [Actinomycetota bacterium]
MGAWKRWKAWERNWTLNPCKYCDAHADGPPLNWKTGSLHRWWCPALTRKIGWAAAFFPIYMRSMDIDWWLCVAAGAVFLALSVILPWLAKRYGPIQGPT